MSIPSPTEAEQTFLPSTSCGTTYLKVLSMKQDFGKPPASIETSIFYDKIMDGEEKRGMIGKDTRYSPSKVAKKDSVARYYVNVVSNLLSKNDKVLDFGCGPGSFLSLTAPFCRSITGADISKKFVDECNRVIKENNLDNAEALKVGKKLPFDNETFDVVILVDVIHHLSNIGETVSEMHRVLKKRGRFIIFEPNKLNPVIALVHLLDKNECGLLSLGTPWKYRRVLAEYVNIERIDFNGVVIGPQSKIFDVISSFLNNRFICPVLGWLNPKMVVLGTKK